MMCMWLYVCEKYNCFMQCDGIHDYIGDIIVNVTSSLDNANLRGG